MDNKDDNFNKDTGLTLSDVFENIGAIKRSPTRYEYAGCLFNVKDDAFYNTKLKRGGVGVNYLALHLLTLSRHCAVSNDLTNMKFFNHDLREQVGQWLQGMAGAEKKNAITKEDLHRRGKLITEVVDNIDLGSVMMEIGANPNEDGQEGKWKILETGDNVAVTGQRWYSWNTLEGGVGAISLMKYYLASLTGENLKNEKVDRELWIQARRKLIESFDINNIDDNELEQYAVSNDKGSSAYALPYAPPLILNSKIDLVRDYLHKERGIPMWIIDKNIENKTLFAGYPSDWKYFPRNEDEEKALTSDRVWATFVSLNGLSAEMRAVDRGDEYSKLLALGSNKEFAGFINLADDRLDEKRIVATEAAIDVLSYCSLYPGRTAVSCMGVTYNLAARMAMETLENKYSFSLAFDNDSAGLEAGIKFINHLELLIGEDYYEKNKHDLSEEELEVAIKEKGKEVLLKHLTSGNVSCFDLTIESIKLSIEKNERFYLDLAVSSSSYKDVVRVLYLAFNREFGSEKINSLVNEGQIKLINLEPNYMLIEDVEKEVDHVIKKLIEKKNGGFYYFTVDGPDAESDTKKAQNQKKFLDLFYQKSKHYLPMLEESGSVVYGRTPNHTKDWNDLLKIKLGNKLENKSSSRKDKIKELSEEIIGDKPKRVMNAPNFR